MGPFLSFGDERRGAVDLHDLDASARLERGRPRRRRAPSRSLRRSSRSRRRRRRARPPWPARPPARRCRCGSAAGCAGGAGRSAAARAASPSEAAMNTIQLAASPPPASDTMAASTAAIAIGPRKKPIVKISPTASAPCGDHPPDPVFHVSDPKVPAGPEQRQARCSTSASRSAVVLAARREADEALRHGVPAPAGAALGARVDAAEAGGVGDQAGGGEEALGALLRAEVERDDRAVAAHLAPRDLVARVVREPRVAHGLHVVAGGEQPRDRDGVVAAALEPQRERGQRAVREPGLERAGDRARVAAPVAERLGRARRRAW